MPCQHLLSSWRLNRPGQLDGAGCISCGYHGWKFNSRGQCVEIPALGKDTKIPRRARVDAYPVEEHFDWVWVFLGDLEEEKRPPIPATEFPEYHDKENWRVVSIDFEGEVNWARGHENSSIAHTPRLCIPGSAGATRLKYRLFPWSGTPSWDTTPPVKESRLSASR